jgi:lipopolysaccharide transport system permease protein
VLNVFMRDVGQVVPVAMQFLYWFTPVVYMANIIPEAYRSWLALNPLVPIVVAYHDILLYNRVPQAGTLVGAAVVAVVSLFVSLVLFRKAVPEMVDQL